MIGKSIKRFEDLDSTNSFVKRNISNLEHGTIIVAISQSEGRGRRDNKWMSKEGNLYFSFVLKNNIERQCIFRYIVEVSLGIINTLKELNIDALIKYPNDCLIDGKKVSGILLESSGTFKLDYIVIGIGINVNQVKFNELTNKATSLKIETKKNYNINNILDKFIKNYNSIIEMNYDKLFDLYLNSSIVIGKTITYNDEKYIISNIERDGTIVIEKDNGERRVAYSEINLKEFY